MNQDRAQSFGEEVANSLNHGLGLLLAVASLPIRSDRPHPILSSRSSDHAPPPRPTRYSNSVAQDRCVGQASG